MAGSMISLESVTKCFGDVVAINTASLCIDRGEVVAILGPSGCGKTTLLRLIAGFERPEAGTIEVAGRIVSDARTWVPPEARCVGMVFQDYALFPHLTVAENIGFGLSRRARPSRVPELLSIVGLDDLGRRYAHEVSGGQQEGGAGGGGVGAGTVLTGPVADGLLHTPLGAFPANGNATSQVLVRPELLELELDPAGEAEVVAREFRGHDVFYRVRLDGVELVSQRPSTEVVPLGARVSIRLHDGRVPILN